MRENPSPNDLLAEVVSLRRIPNSRFVFHVPVYQRSYTWGPKEWKSFWKQIDEIVEGEASSKFLGAIVVDKKSEEEVTAPAEFWVVDGQQRLMTVYLLVVAAAVATQEMAEEYRDLARGDADDYAKQAKALLQTSKYLHKNYLLVGDEFEEDGHRPRLNSALSDLGQFNNILRDLKNPTPSISADYGDFGGGQLTEAYEYMAEQLEVRWKEGPTVHLDYIKDLVSKVLDRLDIVRIKLGAEDDPNEIFENLNFSGQMLTVYGI